MKKIRFVPYGYTIRDGHTVIDHSEADIIRHIFEVYIKGASLKEIADELTSLTVHREGVSLSVPCGIQQPNRIQSIFRFSVLQADTC